MYYIGYALYRVCIIQGMYIIYIIQGMHHLGYALYMVCIIQGMHYIGYAWYRACIIQRMHYIGYSLHRLCMNASYMVCIIRGMHYIMIAFYVYAIQCMCIVFIFSGTILGDYHTLAYIFPKATCGPYIVTPCHALMFKSQGARESKAPIIHTLSGNRYIHANIYVHTPQPFSFAVEIVTTLTRRVFGDCQLL